MPSPSNQNITSITNEAPLPVEKSSEITPTESGGSALNGEIGAEKFVPVAHSPIKTDDGITTLTPPPAKPQTNIVDKSAGATKTKPVDQSADSLTTIADKDEEEFIVGVEAAHNEHK